MRTCDHMVVDESFVFCALNREFPFECRCCKWYLIDADPTPARERLWNYHVGTGEAQPVPDPRSPGEVDE